MSNISVFCVSMLQSQAEHLLDRLKHHGILSPRVSVVFPNQPDASETTMQDSEIHSAQLSKCTAEETSEEHILLKWLERAEVVALEGVGPCLIAGPVREMLREDGVDGIASALRLMGIPDLESRIYHAKLKAGYILIGVDSDSVHEAHAVEQVFKESGAAHITAVGPIQAVQSMLRNALTHLHLLP